ncbi:hypothetical protein [Pseudomarimonas arenosa]|uniref:hypothetical protein n=1 Tax=Pseudomarimonas arenosa TaxID=2774145 RepID=UPI001CDB5BC7|nr:hypothetical protein [Pseudomarimonas arenosa]
MKLHTTLLLGAVASLGGCCHAASEQQNLSADVADEAAAKLKAEEMRQLIEERRRLIEERRRLLREEAERAQKAERGE